MLLYLLFRVAFCYILSRHNRGGVKSENRTNINEIGICKLGIW